MKYKVLLQESEEGFAVSCPILPGCWSQGQTEAEALDNIKEAIQEYLEAREEIWKSAILREVEVVALPRHNLINAITMDGSIEMRGNSHRIYEAVVKNYSVFG